MLFPGPLGKHMDSSSIPTDYGRLKLPCSSLKDMAELAAYLFGKGERLNDLPMADFCKNSVK
jgi:hypothetical protein